MELQVAAKMNFDRVYIFQVDRELVFLPRGELSISLGTQSIKFE